MALRRFALRIKITQSSELPKGSTLYFPTTVSILTTVKMEFEFAVANRKLLLEQWEPNLPKIEEYEQNVKVQKLMKVGETVFLDSFWVSFHICKCDNKIRYDW